MYLFIHDDMYIINFKINKTFDLTQFLSILDTVSVVSKFIIYAYAAGIDSLLLTHM